MAAELEQLRVSLVAELVGREAFEQLKREVNQVKAATAGLDTTQKKLRETVSESEKAVRSQRQAFSQAGMQINQFAGQIAAGTSPMVAFVQQIGDVAYVVGQAGDSMGKVGRFLQGPWAAAILIAISVLGPLVSKLMETKDAMYDIEDYSKRAGDAIEQYYKLIGYTPPIENAINASQKFIKQMIQEGNTALDTAEKHLTRMKVIAQSNLSVVRSEDNIFRRLFGDNPAEKAAAAQAAVDKLNGEIKRLRDALGKPIKPPKAPDVPKVSTPKISGTMKKDIEAIQTLDDLMGDIQNGSAIFGRDLIKSSERIGEAIEKTGLESLGDNITKSIETVKPAVDQIQAPIDRVKSMSEAMGQAFSDGIKGMITGAMTFKQVMSNVIDSVINKLFEMFVVQQITGMIAKGISSLTGIPIPGKKAIGGPVQAGKPYMVGERGPEMFVPSRSGSIVPNKGLGGGMTINVDARGASDPAAVRAQVEMGIAQAAPYIIAAAQNKTLTTAARPRLPGTLG